MRLRVACVVLPIAMSSELVRSPHALADEPAPPLAAPLPSKDVRWYATAAPAIDAGSLPHASPGLSLGFDVRRGGLAARAVASVFLPQVDRGSGVSVALFDMMPMLCALGPIGSRADLGACAGVGVGLLRASTRAESVLGLRPQASATARLDVALWPALLVSADGGVIVDPLRSTLHSTGIGDPYRPPLAALRASLGVHVRW